MKTHIAALALSGCALVATVSGYSESSHQSAHSSRSSTRSTPPPHPSHSMMSGGTSITTTCDGVNEVILAVQSWGNTASVEAVGHSANCSKGQTAAAAMPHDPNNTASFQLNDYSIDRRCVGTEMLYSFEYSFGDNNEVTTSVVEHDPRCSTAVVK